MQIEEELGYLISAETLSQFTSVKHYINYIEHVEAFKKESNKTPLSWLSYNGIQPHSITIIDTAGLVIVPIGVLKSFILCLRVNQHCEFRLIRSLGYPVFLKNYFVYLLLPEQDLFECLSVVWAAKINPCQASRRLERSRQDLYGFCTGFASSSSAKSHFLLFFGWICSFQPARLELEEFFKLPIVLRDHRLLFMNSHRKLPLYFVSIYRCLRDIQKNLRTIIAFLPVTKSRNALFALLQSEFVVPFAEFYEGWVRQAKGRFQFRFARQCIEEIGIIFLSRARQFTRAIVTHSKLFWNKARLQV